MSQTFRTTALAGNRILVDGNDGVDNHKVILDAEEFNGLHTRDLQLAAGEAFDKAVEDFFAPLTAASEALATAAKPDRDPAFFIVIEEGSVGSVEQREIVHYLEKDTVVLRLIEQGSTDRLIWVGDSIEVLASAPQVDELKLEEIDDAGLSA